MKIQYQFADKTVEIEVSDEWGNILIDLDRQEYNNDHKETRRHASLEQVRAVLAEKSHDGFTEQVRGLLQKYGAQKLSAVDPSRYADLMRDAEELTDAGK